MVNVVIGEGRLPRDFRRYSRHFSLVEVDLESGKAPGKARLRACREQAGEDFVFSLVVPRAIAALQGVQAQGEWSRVEAMAELVRPSWWVVRTPAALRPTTRARAQLGELFERLRQLGGRVAWEAAGLWEAAEVVRTARDLGATAVQDIALEPPIADEVLYSRVLALGRGERIGLGAAERIAERALQFEQAVVVIEGSGALTVQRLLGQRQQEDEELAALMDAGEL